MKMSSVLVDAQVRLLKLRLKPLLNFASYAVDGKLPIFKRGLSCLARFS